MKNGKITTIILLYYILTIFYELLYPVFPSFEKPWYYVFFYCFYYIIQYGLLFSVSYYGFKKAVYKVDSLALFTLLFYSAGKFIYYIFVINKDLPTYISICNSKEVSVIISFILWIFAVTVWFKKYSINKLIKF